MLSSWFLHVVESQAMVTKARDVPPCKRVPVPLTRVIVPSAADTLNTVSPLEPETTLPRSGDEPLMDCTVWA
jgi:hypothetical protein